MNYWLLYTDFFLLLNTSSYYNEVIRGLYVTIRRLCLKLMLLKKQIHALHFLLNQVRVVTFSLRVDDRNAVL